MSLYVTLPSNASMDVFPNNTLQSYTVKLESPLVFETEYEVGLCEIMFPKNWKVSIGYMHIINDNEDSEEIEKFFDLIVTDKSPLENVVSEINQLLKNEKMNDFVKLLYDQKSLKYLFDCSDGYQVEINGHVNQVLGFKNNFFTSVTMADDIVYQNSILNIISSLYVYSDIVDHQHVGNMKVQLLRTVSTHINQYSHVDMLYDAPHYISVLKRNISTINITINSDIGEIIRFEKGRVLVKLHFRPI